MIGKLKNTTELKNILKTKNKKTVLCHGVFDLLHIGHIYYLEEAKKNGEILIVSLTSDKFVNKGPSRPVFNEFQRAKMLAALNFVDFVIISNNPTAEIILKELKPSVYCKGPDFRDSKKDLTGKIINETNIVKKYGGKVLFTKSETFSSSNLINKFYSKHSDSHKKNINQIKKKIGLEKILTSIKNIKKLKVLVIGELIIDEYVFCEAVGKSGKEPVMVLKYMNEEKYLGGSSAIARHLSSFNKQITLLTMLGEKKEFLNKIKKELPKNINLKFIKKTNSPTILKKRIIDKLNNSKLLGVYSMNDEMLNNKDETEFIKILKSEIPKHDLIIVTDYGHGFITDKAAKIILKLSKFLAVNAQINAMSLGTQSMRKYKNLNCLTINEKELRYELRQKGKDLNPLIKKLSQDQKIQNLVVTRGKTGAILYNLKKNKFFYNDAYSKNAVDKIGAGDALLTLISLCLKNKMDEKLSLMLASIAAGQVTDIVGNKDSINKTNLLKTLEHFLK